MKQQNRLLVISSYPPKGHIHHKSIVGVASYTKNTLLALRQAAARVGHELQITVLGEELQGPAQYADEGIEVKRVWKRNRPGTYITLLKEIITQHKETDTVVIPLEVAMFGGMLMLALLPFFLCTVKLLGKKTTIILHQVITDIYDLRGHINISNPLAVRVVNLGLILFYRMIFLLSNRVIVFDAALATQLQKFSHKAVTVIPHGVETFAAVPTRRQAREALQIQEDELVLLYFGFISWYKGPDLLIDAYRKLKETDKKIRLIIAGGPNNNHMHKPHYQAYVQSVSDSAAALGAVVTGFVEEEAIPTYFQASDLVILPYRTFMSASGPLSITTALHKPFFLSSVLAPTLHSSDIMKAMGDSGVGEADIVFTSETDLIKKVAALSSKQLDSLTNVSTRIARERSWQQIGKKYYETLFA